MVTIPQVPLAILSRSPCQVIRGACKERNPSTPLETVLRRISGVRVLSGFVPALLYEVFLGHVVQVVVTDPVEEATQTSGAVEVAARRPHRHSHSPLAQVGSNERSRREKDLERQKETAAELFMQ